MATLRDIHDYMNERRSIILGDGRTGKIAKVDTFFPTHETIVTVWLRDSTEPKLVRVGLADVVGPVAVAPAPR